MMPMNLDLIGDIHGELPALLRLLEALGHDHEGDREHPEGRIPVFLGDLIDRGARGVEVAELVARLVGEGRALCLMGNHEYNLVGWHLKEPRFEKAKKSNASTIEDVMNRPRRWAPVLDFFRSLPLSLEFPELRVVHACWHRESLEAIGDLLDHPTEDNPPVGEGVEGPAAWLWKHVRHHSPYSGTRRRRSLPGPLEGQDDPPHAVLIKGFEEPADPFVDNDGKRRERIRSIWWEGDHHAVLVDRPQVVGHYWNLPPVGEAFMPPFPSGHDSLRAWQQETLAAHPDLGGARLPLIGRREGAPDVVCVDFNGVTRATRKAACVGALRWPEREVVWALEHPA